MGGSSGFSQSINNQNQVSTYGYDAAGRLLNDGFTQYTYDSNGMLTTSSDGAAYYYDGADQRASVVLNGVENDYYYFGGRLYAIDNPAGWTDLIYAGNQRIAEVAGTQTATAVYDVLDHIGSEVATVDSSGSVISAMDYTPFGQLLSGTNMDGFVFAGLLRDKDGLDHATMRQYSSVTGRWSTPDPYDGSYSLDDPQSFNRYAYTRNPLFYTDLSGLDSSCGGNVGYDAPNGDLGPPGAQIFSTPSSCGIWKSLVGAFIDFGKDIKDWFRFGSKPFTGNVKTAGNRPPVRAPNNPPCKTGFGLGFTAGADATAGLGYGAGVNGSVGAGLFAGNGLNPGAFASGGAAASAFGHGASAPGANMIGRFFAGLVGGAGAGVFVTNASQADQLSGLGGAWTVDFGSVINGAGQFSAGTDAAGNGIWSFSFTLGYGLGAGYQQMTNKTKTAGTRGGCGG